MNIIGHRKIYYLLSGVMIIASVLGVALFGFRSGIDFAGGTLWEVKFGEGVSPADIRRWLEPHNLGDIQIQSAGEKTVAMRFREVDEVGHQAILKELKTRSPDVAELRFEAVGPTIGHTLRRKAASALVAAILGISIYIAWAFRKVSRPLPAGRQGLASWKYGVATVITLFHDVLVPIGLFSYLGRLGNVEVDSNLIVALLVVMGFSVHDTIVVFDRIRENLGKLQGEFDGIVNRSVNETLARSINTSLTTLLALAAIAVWGAASLKYFVLAMMVGILTGTYSSIFIASPLLVDWEKWQNRK